MSIPAISEVLIVTLSVIVPLMAGRRRGPTAWGRWALATPTARVTAAVFSSPWNKKMKKKRDRTRIYCVIHFRVPIRIKIIRNAAAEILLGMQRQRLKAWLTTESPGLVPFIQCCKSALVFLQIRKILNADLLDPCMNLVNNVEQNTCRTDLSVIYS
jgi:hypothetical protein